MKQILEQRIAALSKEIQQLDAERQALSKRDSEIEIRLHQVIGAIYEMQQVIADLDRQPSEEQTRAFWDSDLVQSTRPSEGVDQDSHQEQPKETEKNSQQQS